MALDANPFTRPLAVHRTRFSIPSQRRRTERLLRIHLAGDEYAETATTNRTKTMIPKLIIPLLLAIFMIGCASAPKNAYKVAAGADLTVSAAHVVFSDLVAAGKVKAETVALANQALETYKHAESALIEARDAYQKTGDKTALNASIAALAAAQCDFIAIVNQYVQPKAKQ